MSTNRVAAASPVTATLTAQNTWTDPMLVQSGEQAALSISGLVDSTVSLQRMTDGTNWRTVWKLTPAMLSAGDFGEKTYFADCRGSIRLGIDTGDYGSDTVVCRINKGG